MITIAVPYPATVERARTASQESCVPAAIIEPGGTPPVMTPCRGNPSNTRVWSQRVPLGIGHAHSFTVSPNSHTIQSPLPRAGAAAQSNTCFGHRRGEPAVVFIASTRAPRRRPKNALHSAQKTLCISGLSPRGST